MQISSLDSKIYISDNLQRDVEAVLKPYESEKKFVLVDENTYRHCWPLVSGFKALENAELIHLRDGEDYKTVESAVVIWDYLCRNGADRKSLMINLGGGLIGDLGGFAASAFKRGIDFVNIPTTLLAQVDASIGGKVGINFSGFKNEIGFFRSPNYVIISSEFLKTLDMRNMLAGYAEMIKHALIYSSSYWDQLKGFDFNTIDYKKLQTLVSRSVAIKNEFVQKDFRESHIRKALNFGHTIGHAFESRFLAAGTPLLHGEAVAHGMICELYLSHKGLNFPIARLNEISSFILARYGGKISFTPQDYDTLFELMLHDKKNEQARINFSLLSDFGEVKVNEQCRKELIAEALDFYLGFEG